MIRREMSDALPDSVRYLDRGIKLNRDRLLALVQTHLELKA